MLANIAVLRTVKANVNEAIMVALPSILFESSHDKKDTQKYYLPGPVAEYIPVEIPDTYAKKILQVRYDIGDAACPSQQQNERLLWS